jgi:hypothetical protein
MRVFEGRVTVPRPLDPGRPSVYWAAGAVADPTIKLDR